MWKRRTEESEVLKALRSAPESVSDADLEAESWRLVAEEAKEYRVRVSEREAWTAKRQPAILRELRMAREDFAESDRILLPSRARRRAVIEAYWESRAQARPVRTAVRRFVLKLLGRDV